MRSSVPAIVATVLVAVVVTGCSKPATMQLDPALQAELLDMAEKDQEIRTHVAEKYPAGGRLDPADAERWMAIDAANTARMKEIVDARGWPGFSLVGEDGALAAFLLVQHADADPAFQERCLPLLAEAVEAGEASPRDVAYLTDRIRMHAGEPQVYGTQVHWVDGAPEPLPIEDPDRVDERRAEVGLGPLSEYMARFSGVAGDDDDDDDDDPGDGGGDAGE
ncbi:MAG: DUF6624 domain-containing protein [Planctomycetota bacterium]|jgi:hypothetical protein